jgi:hypothetical protein
MGAVAGWKEMRNPTLENDEVTIMEWLRYKEF